MRGGASSDLLEFWDWGRVQSPARRALGLLLAAADPSASWEELEGWTIGRRDRGLLEVRRRLFGPHLSCVVSCPACGGLVELEFEVDDVCAPEEPGAASPAAAPELEADGFVVTWRPPTCGDLLKLEGAVSVEQARRRLLECCVLAARHDGRPVAPGDLSPAAHAALAEALAAADPQAGSRLDLECPDCDHRWLAPFDIAAFLWAEVEAQARRLLDEVHRLATAYRWGESEILAMADVRRWAYLELLSG